MIERIEQYRELPVALTEAERLDFQRSMLEAMDEIDRLEGRLADYKDQIKGLRADQSSVITECREVLKRGSLEKRVACELIKDYQQGIIKVVRLDTDDVVESRAMEPKERQQGLALVPPKKTLAQRNEERIAAEWAAWLREQALADGEDPDAAVREAAEAEAEKSGRVVRISGRKKGKGAA
ncbi:hypothetical protein [Desulfarculus baarsii]